MQRRIDLGLNDKINSQAKKSQINNSKFISLRDIYIHLKNRHPDASSEDILLSFDAEYKCLEQKPEFYVLTGGHLARVIAHAPFGTKSSSFEQLGNNSPVTLSRIVTVIKADPLAHRSANEYGFIRDEINIAMGEDFPKISSGLRDYEAEIENLKIQIAELQQSIKEIEPSPNAERHATKKADVLSALLSIMFHPEFYVDVEDIQRKMKSDFTSLNLIRETLPSQTKLVELVNQKGRFFWPKTATPPLADRTIEVHLSEAINRIKNAK